ncbi:MAG: isochorismatase family protein [Lachnospiraceae bacterium]|nr:isochorismatase family protein [Lachnospiraceae bacterium]
MEEHEVNNLEIIGVDGNYCVASTALDAKKPGYSVKLLCNAIGVQNKKRFEQKKEILFKNGIEVDVM